jgi:sodium transport system ATP-binding protein
MHEVEKLCDRVAIMAHGRIVDAGTLDELRDRHREQDVEEIFFKLVDQPAAPAA